MRKIGFLFFVLLSLTSVLFAADWYVRPSGGNYGLENGTSYANAWDGLLNVKWGAGGVQPGDTLWVCGLHIHNMVDRGYVATQADIPVISGTGESTRVTIRGDYPGDPGIVWGAARLSYEAWVDEGNNVWSITCPAYLGVDWYSEDITATSWKVLSPASTLEECQNTPGSHYSPEYKTGSKLYVHCSDNGNPTGRIYAAFGYDFVNRGGKSYITYLNLKMYYLGCGVWNNNDAHHLRWQGCTVWYAGYLFPLFDGCHYMEVIDCDIAHAGNGIYIISNTNNAASYCTFKGNVIHDIGVRASQQNGDAHGVGIQGGHDNIIEDNYFYNCGTTICLYAFTNQELKNTIIRRNFV
jgi:hypothetical protein